MPKTALAVVAVTICGLFVTAFAQERSKSKTPSTVSEFLSEAGTSFGEGHLAECLSQIRAAITLVSAERERLIRATLPAAPKGLERMPPDEGAANRGRSAAAMVPLMGTGFTQEYRGDDKSLTVTVTVDSPIAPMFDMMLDRPELFEKGSKVIQYGPHKGILKEMGSGTIQLLLKLDTTMIQIDSDGISDDGVLAFMDQKAVDALAAALAK